MIRPSLLVAAAALVAAPLATRAAEYEIDPAHTEAGFKVRHMMVTNVRGEFGKVAGTVTWDPKNPGATKIDVTIDASSIATGVEKRDAHLRSPDFFDVAKFPNLTFRSKKVEPAGAGKLKVTGDLTMRGVTKEVVLAVDGPTAEFKDPWGGTHVGASGTTTVNRRDFGLNWNQALEAGGLLVGEEVEIVLEVELTRKADAVAMPAKAPAKK